ncbi:hypothetical protein EJ110_NYTH57811 [Nymphaea thermarum]|nr:hypothetical protein EJ110_NYTH57811 [Nymphaea thermarum]
MGTHMATALSVGLFISSSFTYPISIIKGKAFPLDLSVLLRLLFLLIIGGDTERKIRRGFLEMASETLSRIGLAGLAVMGQNLALNVAEKGFPISHGAAKDGEFWRCTVILSRVEASILIRHCTICSRQPGTITFFSFRPI